MSLGTERTKVSRVFDVVQQYYDISRVAVYLGEHGVLTTGEMWAIRGQPYAPDKVEMLKAVFTEDPSRVGPLISAVISFSDEGKAKLEQLNLQSEGVELRNLFKTLPDCRPVSEAEVDAPRQSYRRLPQRSASSVSQDSGSYGSCADCQLSRRGSGPVYHISGPVEINHHHHYHSNSHPADSYYYSCLPPSPGSSLHHSNVHTDTYDLTCDSHGIGSGIKKAHTFSSGDQKTFQRHSMDTHERRKLRVDQDHILREHTPDLLKYMNVRSVLPYLRARNLITDDDWDYLTNTTRIEQERIHFLLSIIPRRGPSAVSKFLDSLSEDSDHEGHQYLAKTLRLKLEIISRDE